MEKYDISRPYGSVDIPAWVVRIPYISHSDKLIYSYILKNQQKSYFNVSRNIIADIIGISEKTVKRTFKKLEEYGIIYDKKRLGLGKPNVYKVKTNKDEVFEIISNFKNK